MKTYSGPNQRPIPRRPPWPGAESTHLAVVDADDGADHLGDDDHVAEVGLDDCGFLVWGRLLLGLAELLDEAHGLALETALEPTAGAGVDDLCVVRQRKDRSDVESFRVGRLMTLTR